MKPYARKVYYLVLMPFLFIINLMITFSWFDTTIIMLIIMIFVMILRISDKGKHFVALNDWVKRNTLFIFPEIYETGVMPTTRALLICIPCMVAVVLNIPISNIVR